MTAGMGGKLLAFGIFLVAVAAYVFTDVRGGDTGGLMVLIGPVIAAIFLDSAVKGRLAPLQQTVDKVEKQTNGVLDARIRKQVLDALAEHVAVNVPGQMEAAAPATPDQPAAGEPPSTATMPPGFLTA